MIGTVPRQIQDSSGPTGFSSPPAPTRRILPRMSTHATQRTGFLYGIAAYAWWGLIPLYFKATANVSPWEVLTHRVIWSLALLAALTALRGRWGLLVGLLRDRRTLATMSATMLLIATNWLVFIWAVANGRVLQASLGYFINPLVNVLLGRLFLGERLRPLQASAVVLAALAVAWLALGHGELPVISLVLALSFSLYGLLRKLARPDGTQGLTIETLLLAPAALAWLAWREAHGGTAFLHAWPGTTLLLAAAGIVTALPLVWFAEAARRLRYGTVGFLQYITPTSQFLLAVAVFGEPFTRDHALTFVAIWAALGLYSWDALRNAAPRRSPLADGG